MKQLIFVMLVACGGGQHAPANPPPGDGSAGVVKDTRSPIEKRRDAACEALAPKLTQCALEDARKTVPPDEFKKKKLDEPALLAKHKQEFLDKCMGSQMSSRQVRVLEVCFKEETECDPLAQCLSNLAPANK